MAAIRKSICNLLKRNNGIAVGSSYSPFNNNFNYMGIGGIIVNTRFSHFHRPSRKDKKRRGAHHEHQIANDYDKAVAQLERNISLHQSGTKRISLINNMAESVAHDLPAYVSDHSLPESLPPNHHYIDDYASVDDPSLPPSLHKGEVSHVVSSTRSGSSEDMYGSQSGSSEDMYRSKSGSSEDMYWSKAGSSEDMYGSKSRSSHDLDFEPSIGGPGSASDSDSEEKKKEYDEDDEKEEHKNHKHKMKMRPFNKRREPTDHHQHAGNHANHANHHKHKNDKQKKYKKRR